MANKKEEKEYEVSDHGLSVSSARSLYRIIRDNKIAPKYRGRMAKVLAWTIVTQPLQLIQKAIVYPKLKTVDFNSVPPIFILGHWRSGTTHLHYLLATDPQLGFMTNYQAFFLRMSFVGKGWMDKILNHFMPATRPQDNVIMNAYKPSEEEQPFSTITYASGVHSFFFPQNQSYHDKYNLFKGISAEEKKEWLKKYDYMLKLISLDNKNKPLILKNPHSTGRVKELLELYPNAKFIFLHRNPYDVYLSTNHLFKKMIQTQFFQEFSVEETSDRVMENYVSTLQKYIRDRSLIPEGNLVEISFKELESDGLATTEKIYKSLNIPNYDKAKVSFKEYLEAMSDYKKNKFEEIPQDQMERIRKEWKFAFDEWNYPLDR